MFFPKRDTNYFDIQTARKHTKNLKITLFSNKYFPSKIVFNFHSLERWHNKITKWQCWYKPHSQSLYQTAINNLPGAWKVTATIPFSPGIKTGHFRLVALGSKPEVPHANRSSVCTGNHLWIWMVHSSVQISFTEVNNFNRCVFPLLAPTSHDFPH